MKHAFKKIMALLMVAAMILGILPMAFAADVCNFTDVQDTDWFAPYVQYVYEHDPQLMNGTSDTTFEPNGTCNRAMAAVVLYRMADPVASGGYDCPFVDLTESWYQTGVIWAYREGIVNGVDETHFDPYSNVTREQLVTLLWRYYEEPAVEEDFLSEFVDKDSISSYAVDAFNWAISMGIINGYEETDGKWLRPQGEATRAEFAKIINVFMIATVGCEGNHTWGEGVETLAPTCTEPGVMTYTCSVCGETKTEEIPALGHDFVDGACSRCDEALAEEGEIVIYYTNDVHTYIDGAMSYDTVADLKAQTAAVADGVLLVDAGDHIQGTAHGSLDKGQTIVELMSAAGYDFATLGNHEFDYGMARALEIVEQADYEYLSSNFYHEENGVKGDTVLDAYRIVEIGEIKIAIVGITTPESFTKSTPAYFQDEEGNYIYGIGGGSDGAALYADVQAAIDAAEAEGADYIIALGHLGDDPASKPWTSEELIANTSGLDAFIDGHSHSTVAGEEILDKNGETVLLTQTGEYFEAIGKMTITAEGITTELITEWAGSDESVAEIKNAWIVEVDRRLGEKIGYAEVTLDNYDADGNRMVRKYETNTGDFAADALYYLFDNMDMDVDVAIMNGGGVRNKAITGEITYRTCKDIHTFGNVACLQTITGQQLLDALEWGARDTDAAECGGFLQVSGITYEVHTYIPATVQKDDKGVWIGGPTGEYRVKNVKILQDGEYVDLDLDAEYNLAGYNYTLRDLGDGFAMFDGAVNVLDYVMEDYLVLANYIKSFEADPEHDNLPTIQSDSIYAEVTGAGRITLVKEAPANKVAIYNNAAGKAMTTATSEYNGKAQLGSAAATLGDDGKLTTAANNIAEFYMETVDGITTFKTEDGKYLSCDGTNLTFVAAKDDNCEFILEETEGGYFIRLANFLYNGTYAQYIEFFHDVFTCYGMGDDTGIYTFNFYEVKQGEIDVPDGDFILSDTIEAGDEVIIVCAAKNMALSSTYNGYYNSAVAVTPVDGKIANPAADIIWTVGKNGDNYTFSFNGQNIGMGSSYSSMPLGEVNDQWSLLPGNTEGTYFLFNVGRQVYMEYYESNSNWSGYYNNANAELFELHFYVKGDGDACEHVWGEGVETTAPTCTEDGVMTYTCTLCGATKTEVIAATGHTDANGDDLCDDCGASIGGDSSNAFVLSDTLEAGDEVIIVCAAKNMALSSTYNGYYNSAVAVTPVDGKITDAADDIIWTVGKNGDNYTFSFNGQNIGMASSYSSMPLGEVNDQWSLLPGNTEGTYFLFNIGREVYMEYYEKNSNWSGYYNNADAALFELQFYVKGAIVPPTCEHVWDDGVETAAPTCTENGVMTYTCTLCGETKTESIEATGHLDENDDNVCDNCGTELEIPAPDAFVLSDTLEAGDEVIIVCAAKNMALSSTYNGYYNSAVAVTPVDGKIANPAADIIWTVGKNGDNYTFSFNGQNIGMASSYSSMPLGEVNDQWSLLPGNTEGTYFLFNVGREVYMEYYEKNSNWSGYYNNADAALFELQFYVKGAEDVPACEHDWDEGVVSAEPTCTEAGVITYTCNLCGDIKTEAIAATGHADEDGDDYCDACDAFVGVPEGELTEIAFEDIKAEDAIVIVMHAPFSDEEYVLLNTCSSSSKGVAAVFDATATDASMYWNIVAAEDGYTIYKQGSTTEWLYFSDTNNGVLVGSETNGSVFNFGGIMEGQSDYLYTSLGAKTRCLCVYDNNSGEPAATINFRCYDIKSDGLVHANGRGQSITFYKVG